MLTAIDAYNINIFIAAVAQLVEHSLGKTEVTSSILVGSSILYNSTPRPERQMYVSRNHVPKIPSAPEKYGFQRHQTLVESIADILASPFKVHNDLYSERSRGRFGSRR